MRQGARIEAAIEILQRIKNNNTPMDNTIRDYMHFKRYIGSKDRAAIVELVYGTVRGQARIGWWLAKAKLEDTPRSRVIAQLMLGVDKLSPHNVTIRFTGEKYQPEALSDAEEKALSVFDGQELSHAEQPSAVRVECPEWAEKTLQDLFGEDFEEQLEAMMLPAKLDLRVNTLMGTVVEAQDSLAKDNVITHATPYSDIALRVEEKAYMTATKAFNKGLVEIQDEGSQLITLICGVAPGMRVLDYCAGGGGKTLGIAAAMENKGNIVAMDIDSRRLEKGRRRYKKAGVHNVELRGLDDEKNRKWLRRQKGTMDVVLVDAPCSSSGTWRRNPDLRWNWYGPSLEEIKVLQRDILERVKDKTKVGGRLIYATCSLLPEENEDQVKLFLENNPNYKLMPLADIWPVNRGKIPTESPYLRMFPKDHETDGFFAVALQRVS